MPKKREEQTAQKELNPKVARRVGRKSFCTIVALVGSFDLPLIQSVNRSKRDE